MDDEGGAVAPDRPFVAHYARGRDYHKVLKKRCHRLAGAIRDVAPEFEGRCFVDTAPLMERGLARLAGLGWIGRNGCLIVPGLGSYVLLAEIVCNLHLVPDEPTEAGCGDCRLCVEACPTGACSGEVLVDARKCLSYLTVEHRGEIAPPYRAAMGARVFGCDTCQVVCPHNRDLPAGDADLLDGREPLGGATLAEMLDWTEPDWDAATRGCATRRAKLEQMLRNVAIAAGNSADITLIEPLRRLRDRHPDLTGSADWALDRLAGKDG